MKERGLMVALTLSFAVALAAAGGASCGDDNNANAEAGSAGRAPVQGGSGGDPSAGADGENGGSAGVAGTIGGASGAGGQAGGTPLVVGNVEDCAPLPVDSAQWQLRGSATKTAYLQITPNVNGASGGLWWSVPKNFDDFDASFEFNVFPQWNTSSALGFAFVWITGDVAPPATTSFDTFGLPQSKGWALAFDARPADAPPYPSFLLYNGSNGALARGNDITSSEEVREFADGIAPPDSWNAVTLRVRKNADRTSQTYRASLLYRGTALFASDLAYSSFRGLFGFTGSTPAFDRKSQFGVRNVRLFIPGDGGCVRPLRRAFAGGAFRRGRRVSARPRRW
jgi:hypothetical protein